MRWSSKGSLIDKNKDQQLSYNKTKIKMTHSRKSWSWLRYSKSRSGAVG